MENDIRQQSILIIDGENDATMQLASALKNSGYLTTEARSAQEAMIHLFARRFDLVFLAGALPDRDGFQFLAEIQIRDPHTPVLMMIDQAAIDRAVEAIQQGAKDYLVKPLDPSQMIGYVSMVFQDAQRRQ